MERDFTASRRASRECFRIKKIQTQDYMGTNNTIDKEKWVGYFTSLYAGEMEEPRIIQGVSQL